MKFQRIIIFFLSILWFLPVYAALNLELTQGVSNQLPIAVLPFSGSENLDARNDISAIIKNDLNHSGRFDILVLPQTKLAYSVEQISEIYWRKKQIDDVVVGKIINIKPGYYRVQFSLIDVSRKKNLLYQKAFIVTEAQLRHLAHHISDCIYEKLTGLKGVFSTRIAYVLITDKNSSDRRYHLQVADMDGLNAKSLLTSTQPIMSPAWSHDGSRLAYVSFEKISPRIYIQHVNSGQRELISSYQGVNGAPAWSPSDKMLALALSKGSTAPKIYLMNLNTRTLRQITFGPSIDTEPSFSKDGRSLLFTSDRGGNPQIYQLNLNSGTVKRVTFSGNYNARASFSNDDKAIVLLTQEEGAYNVAIQYLDNNDDLHFLSHSGCDSSPSFAPNGQMVLYESKRRNRSILAMSSIDGRVSLCLPSPEGDVQDPIWSPFTL